MDPWFLEVEEHCIQLLLYSTLFSSYKLPLSWLQAEVHSTDLLLWLKLAAEAPLRAAEALFAEAQPVPQAAVASLKALQNPAALPARGGWAYLPTPCAGWSTSATAVARRAKLQGGGAGTAPAGTRQTCPGSPQLSSASRGQTSALAGTGVVQGDVPGAQQDGEVCWLSAAQACLRSPR